MLCGVNIESAKERFAGASKGTEEVGRLFWTDVLFGSRTGRMFCLGWLSHYVLLCCAGDVTINWPPLRPLREFNASQWLRSSRIFSLSLSLSLSLYVCVFCRYSWTRRRPRVSLMRFAAEMEHRGMEISQLGMESSLVSIYFRGYSKIPFIRVYILFDSFESNLGQCLAG